MCALFSLTSCAQAQIKASDFNMQEVGSGIYVHHGKHLDIAEGYQGDICNIGFIVGSRGVAVVDTGGNLKIGNQLRDAIKKTTHLPILYVINTHVHPDHIFGNAAFLQDKPQFVGHEKLGHAMELRHETYDRINIKYMGDDAKGADIVKPTIVVKDTLTLDLGDRTLLLTAYPTAHTNTDITVQDSKTSTMWTGDLLFIERTPVVEGDIKGFIAAIDKLKTYSVKLAVPGHGPVTQEWLKALNNEQRYFNTLLADIRSAIKKGASMESAMDSAAASEKDNWLLFNIANRRNVNTIFPALEWE
ncbi:MAG: quinoprotein relay system zinc metallohydrolase 2 [Methylotenera sp.]